MAVPRRGNGFVEDEEEDEGLFDNEEEEEMGWVDLEPSPHPPHLRALAEAAQLGNLEALRLALGIIYHIPPLPYYCRYFDFSFFGVSCL